MSGEADRAVCSRAGCRRTAAVEIHWRNPRIHGGDRRKTWRACEDHADYLRGFLSARGFPLTVQSVGA